MEWKLTEYNQGVALAQFADHVIMRLGDGDAHLNSIYTDASVKLNQLISITYKVKTVEGTPQFYSMDGGAPANLSPMIAKDTSLDGRWYVNGDPRSACALLQPALDKGAHTYVKKLTPDQWQDVNGQQDANGFKQGVADARVLEIVFGGKFRAHGVQVRGGKVKIILSVEIK